MVGVGCEPRIDVILKMQNSWGGGGGYEPRIEVILEMQKEKRKSGVGWM